VERIQQIQLSKHWKKDVVKQKKMPYGTIDYVDHTQVTQKLIALIPDVHISINYNAGNGGYIYEDHTTQDGDIKSILVGVSVTVSGTIDNRYRTVDEVGMCDKPFEVEGGKSPANNGERAKECMSDAIKRCGLRLGIGLELYGKDTNSWVSSFLEGNLESETKKEKTNDKPKEEVKQAQELIDNAENNLNELIGDYKAEETK
jgi:hypothetical protein